MNMKVAMKQRYANTESYTQHSIS